MFENVKVGDKFVSKADNNRYLVYKIHGRTKNYLPDSGEAVVFLQLADRRIFSSPQNLASCPETHLHLFFDKGK